MSVETQSLEIEFAKSDALRLSKATTTQWFEACENILNTHPTKMSQGDMSDLRASVRWAMAVPEKNDPEFCYTDCLVGCADIHESHPSRFIKKGHMTYLLISQLVFRLYFDNKVFEERNGLPLLNCLCECDRCRLAECKFVAIAKEAQEKAQRSMNRFESWARAWE